MNSSIYLLDCCSTSTSIGVIYCFNKKKTLNLIKLLETVVEEVANSSPIFQHCLITLQLLGFHFSQCCTLDKLVHK